MTKFEKSCREFKKRYGYMTPNQERVLQQIKKERKQKTNRSHYITDREFDSTFASAFDWGS